MMYERVSYISITSFKRIAAVPTGMNKCNIRIIKTSEDIHMAKQIRHFRSVGCSGFYILNAKIFHSFAAKGGNTRVQQERGLTNRMLKLGRRVKICDQILFI